MALAALAGTAFAEKALLDFSEGGERRGQLTRNALRHDCKLEVVSVDDPYYGRPKRFHACPLRRVLELGFGRDPAWLAGHNVFLRARDGYTKPASGDRLLERGGYLALADADRGPVTDFAFDPIDRRQVDPSPFYLVWNGAGQADPHRYPWPYQLATFDVAPFETEYPHTVPTGLPRSAAAWRGYRLFRAECSACHAINGEGGTVGPELNVPQSIVEYRDAAQLKAFIRNPRSFRYTSMPSHEHLSDTDLEALLAYFAAMKDRKRDPAEATNRIP
ncbi:MAG: cytochrome c [Proteobacteria bacterium]|nr:cytochrome c [Pseudomonadota bacterium]